MFHPWALWTFAPMFARPDFSNMSTKSRNLWSGWLEVMRLFWSRRLWVDLVIYQLFSDTVQKDALPQEIHPLSHIWTAACENLTMVQQNKNVKEQLTLVDCQLLNLVKSATFTWLIDYALYTAANLQCAINYNVLSLKKRKEYTDALLRYPSRQRWRTLVTMRLPSRLCEGHLWIHITRRLLGITICWLCIKLWVSFPPLDILTDWSTSLGSPFS